LILSKSAHHPKCGSPGGSPYRRCAAEASPVGELSRAARAEAPLFDNTVVVRGLTHQSFTRLGAFVGRLASAAETIHSCHAKKGLFEYSSIGEPGG
jgi:hypothetical protein